MPTNHLAFCLLAFCPATFRIEGEKRWKLTKSMEIMVVVQLIFYFLKENCKIKITARLIPQHN